MSPQEPPGLWAGRKAAHDQTAPQTTPQVVSDLGNLFVDMYTTDPEHMGNMASVAFWSDSLSRNVKVLRLIEEGRADPGRIIPLLEQAMDAALAAYNDVGRAKQDYDRKWAAGEVPPPRVADNDPYYAAHFRYEDPTYELKRLHHVLYSSFYVLVNIDASLDADLLRRWISTTRPRSLNCQMMDIWLIDRYFEQPAIKDSQAAIEHRRLLGGADLSGARQNVFAWDAVAQLGESTDPPMIEVRIIPPARSMTRHADEAVIGQFLQQ